MIRKLVRRLVLKFRIWRIVRRLKNGPPTYLGQTYDPSASDFVDPRTLP